MTRAAKNGSAGLVVLVPALLLAVASAAFAVRAGVLEPPAANVEGHYAAASGRPSGAGRAVALIGRLSRGLISLQRPDGGFDLGADGGYNYAIERIAASALATAALAHVRGLRPHVEVEGLDDALVRGLAFVKKQQIETGAIGRDEPKDRWSQVDATSAGLLAFVLSDRPEDRAAARAAAGALRRFSRAGLRNGWTRAFATMTIARIARLGLGDEIFDRGWRQLVEFRELKTRPSDRGVQASDWNVAEAISRVVLGLRKGVDPFPAQVVVATLADLPVWSGQSSDCQAWWMQAWLAARSGSPDTGTWFADLLRVLETEAVEQDGTIHGGWYANTLSQTAGAIFALSEGFGP
jgi:hypothetical protein